LLGGSFNVGDKITIDEPAATNRIRHTLESALMQPV